MRLQVVCQVPSAWYSVGAGEGIRTPDLLITNQLLYRPELRQPKQKWNYSTSCATRAISTGSTIGGDGTLSLPSSFEERDAGGH